MAHKQILILETDVATWQFIRRTLREAGYRTLEAATVAEAHTAVASSSTALALAIINVSISRGFDLATELACGGAGVKILYISSELHCVVLDSIARLTPDAVI